MKYEVSEHGDVTEFSDLNKALKYCKERNIGPFSNNGLLWINGDSREDIDIFRNDKEYNGEYMRLTYSKGSKQYIWCDVYKKWYDYNKYFDFEEDLD